MYRQNVIAVAAIAMVMVFSGCSLQNKVPPTSKYLLKVTDDKKVATPKGCQEKVLRIGLVESPMLLSTNDIVYETDSGRSYNYTKARWMASVNEQLSNLLTRSITRQKMFSDVIELKSYAKNDLLLESNIYAFSQTIHKDGSSTLNISVKFVLLEQYRRNIVASKLIELEREGIEGSVEGAVKGYAEMVDELLSEVNLFLNSSCEQ